MRTNREWAFYFLDSGLIQHFRDRKINGIKEIRSQSQLGLKEAKEIFELAEVLLTTGAWADTLEGDVARAVASLTGATPPEVESPKRAEPPARVWVVEEHYRYEGSEVRGIYATAEVAMKRHPDPHWRETSTELDDQWAAAAEAFTTERGVPVSSFLSCFPHIVETEH